MSGDPLMAYWSSQYDVACCLLYGMCECEQSCDQSYVKRGLLPPADERDALARLLDESLEREKALEAGGDAADGFDWTAWAHGHIAVVEQENSALAARVRELEEAQGELLELLDLTDHSPPCDESCSSWIEWGECTCGRAGSVRR